MRPAQAIVQEKVFFFFLDEKKEQQILFLLSKQNRYGRQIKPVYRVENIVAFWVRQKDTRKKWQRSTTNNFNSIYNRSNGSEWAKFHGIFYWLKIQLFALNFLFRFSVSFLLFFFFSRRITFTRDCNTRSN